VEQSDLLKLLVGVIAVLVLFLRGLLDYLKGRKEKAPPGVTPEQLAAALEPLHATLKNVITEERADTMLKTTARKQHEHLLGKIPCYGRPPGEDCSSRVRDALESDLQHVSDMVAQVLMKLVAGKGRPDTLPNMPPRKRK